MRQRIENVLDWATARKFRSGDNPARWRGHLDKLLPKTSKVHRVRSHPALPFAETPEFMIELRSRDSISARALEFTILTACRTGEVIKATWDEINFAERVWSIPAERMKAGKSHKVPLSDRAVEILKALPRVKGNPHVFVGAREGAPLSNMAMLELMKHLRSSYVPHGFRSTFRDWAAEQTNYPNHVVEKALAHTVADKVEAAYRRGDLFEHRRRLMIKWAEYCSKKPVESGTVVRWWGRDMVVYPDNSIPLNQAYWHVAGELDPLPHPLPVTNDKTTIDLLLKQTRHQTPRKRLDKFKKQWRLSLAARNVFARQRRHAPDRATAEHALRAGWPW